MHDVDEYAIDKSKCKDFKVDCPPRDKLTCRKGKTIPKCTIAEAPYPAFSDCKVIFPKLNENECTRARNMSKKQKVSYPPVGKGASNKSDPCKSKKYSTMAYHKNFSTMSTNSLSSGSLILRNNLLMKCKKKNAMEVSRNFSTALFNRNLASTVNILQGKIYFENGNFLSNTFHERYYSSKNSNQLSDLFDILAMHKPNKEVDNKEIALKILKAVEEGLKLLAKTNSLSIDNYSKIREELTTLSTNYKADNLYDVGSYLISRDYLINLWPFMCNNHPAQQQSNVTYDDEDNIMKICKTISGYQENSVFKYEESGESFFILFRL